MNMDRKEKAEKLIEAIAGGNFSDELRGRLRDWFLDIPEESIEEQALAEWATRNIKPDTSIPTKKEKSEFQKLVSLLGIHKDNHRAKTERTPLFFRRGLMLRAAAVLVPVLVAGGAYLIFNTNKKVEIERFVLSANHESGRQVFTLPDGSVVTLTNGSQLEYTSEFASVRNVVLDGQAFFDVTHDQANPFAVKHEGFNVTVLGTEFHVRAHNNIPEAEIVLLSGSVNVEVGAYSQKLVPGQKLLLDKTRLEILEHTQAGPGTIMRLSGGDLKIEDTHASEAIAIVADYFEMKYEKEEGLDSDNYISIMLPNGASVETAIASLNRLSDNATFHISGDTIYGSRK